MEKCAQNQDKIKQNLNNNDNQPVHIVKNTTNTKLKTFTVNWIFTNPSP